MHTTTGLASDEDDFDTDIDCGCSDPNCPCEGVKHEMQSVPLRPLYNERHLLMV